MKKEEFYNEHVCHTDIYQASVGVLPDDKLMDVLDTMFDRGVVSISKFNYREGMDIDSPEAASTGFMNGLTVKAVDSFLRSSAAGIGDGEEGNQYIARIAWRSRSGKLRTAVTKIALEQRDRDNDRILEQRLCDKYVNTYEHKVENSRFHCYELKDMLRLPEMRAFMLDEAKQYVVENYWKESRVLVEDKDTRKNLDVQVWMVPDDRRIFDNGVKGKGR